MCWLLPTHSDPGLTEHQDGGVWLAGCDRRGQRGPPTLTGRESRDQRRAALDGRIPMSQPWAIDADGHVTEWHIDWAERFPPELRDRAPLSHGRRTRAA